MKISKNENKKINFGKRKGKNAQKSYNKHTKSSKIRKSNRGQGK